MEDCIIRGVVQDIDIIISAAKKTMVRESVVEYSNGGYNVLLVG